MTQDLLSETRIRLRDLARRESVNLCTCWRWIQRGVANVRLESFAVGGKGRFTTEEAYRRWVDAVTRAKGGQQPVVHSRTNRRAAADRAAAREELAEAGVM
jgi:hypothetical protein